MAQAFRICGTTIPRRLARGYLIFRRRRQNPLRSIGRSGVRKLGPTLLLITCPYLYQPLKSIHYWGSTVLDLGSQTLDGVLAIRWQVETFFVYDKDLLGSDHNQILTAEGILRFWTQTACLLSFLGEQRGSSAQTCGEARRAIPRCY